MSFIIDRLFGVMYYHIFSKRAAHRWIEEKGYIYEMNHNLFIYQCNARYPS